MGTMLPDCLFQVCLSFSGEILVVLQSLGLLCHSAENPSFDSSFFLDDLQASLDTLLV